MKIISYNVNGIRAAIRKGFLAWLAEEDPDMVCLQEVKASLDQIDPKDFAALGYQVYWMEATSRKGYSGVAILTKHRPRAVTYGCGLETYDREGRVIRADFDDFSLMSVYMPSGSAGDERQRFKMQWLRDFYQYIDHLKHEFPRLIISGDYNICHRPIDIHDPVRNKNCSGFLPEERAWVSQFLEAGFVDTFRYFNDEPHHYSWWSYRAGARAKNLGWRIDYHMASRALQNSLAGAAVLPSVTHSDHCPVVLNLRMN
jgi:exodeoxyribonuclease-3